VENKKGINFFLPATKYIIIFYARKNRNDNFIKT
jgi:hypothetical protein